MNHDTALAGVTNDVPHHQEVTGQIQFANDGKLVLKLCADFLRHRLVALGRAFPGHRFEKTLLRFSVRNGIARKLVAEICQRESASLGDFTTGSNGCWQVAKQSRHFRRRFQETLAITRQATADLIDRHAGIDTAEYVLSRPRARSCVANVISGHYAQSARSSLVQHGAIAFFFLGIEMTLNFQECTVATENHGQCFRISARTWAEQRHQTCRMLVEHRDRRGPLAFSLAMRVMRRHKLR